MDIVRLWTAQTNAERLVKEGMAMARTPDCKPWCAVHAVLDDGVSTFCMGPDIRTPQTSNGYVGITYFVPEGIFIDLGNFMDSVSVDDAEEFGKAILAQVARARGQEA